MRSALGHSLMVEHRTLTPLVLVRIQLPQPKIQPPKGGGNFWFVVEWFNHLQRTLQKVRNQVDCGSETNRNRHGLRAAGTLCRASESSCPDHTSRLRCFGWQATQAEQQRRKSVHRSLGEGGQK